MDLTGEVNYLMIGLLNGECHDQKSVESLSVMPSASKDEDK